MAEELTDQERRVRKAELRHLIAQKQVEIANREMAAAAAQLRVEQGRGDVERNEAEASAAEEAKAPFQSDLDELKTELKGLGTVK